MNLGDRIYKLRTEKNLSQGELADALEVSRQSISKWETGASVPELDKLIKLSALFEVSLDMLITGKEIEIKEEQEDNVPQAEPQVIYVERPAKPSITAAQILGIILLASSLLCFVLFACFGKKFDLLEVFLLCLPVALWGMLCIVSKHPLVWSLWCVSAIWWLCVFILSWRWEQETLFLFLGIALSGVSLWYTVLQQKKGQIHIPAWGWALIAIILTAAALLLCVNLIPPLEGSTTRPSEIVWISDASMVPD